MVSLQLNRQLNTLLLLLALGMISHRVLLPFSQPPLVVHQDGRIEICSWHGAGQRLLLSPTDAGPLQVELSGTTCPACLSQPLVHLNLPSLQVQIEQTPLLPQLTSRVDIEPPAFQRPLLRAPPSLWT